MIQRIQSIFFLLTAACFGGEFGTSFASSDVSAAGIFQDNSYTLSDHPSLQVITGLGILLAIAAIFLYKNRDLQIKVGYGALTMAILLPVVAAVLFMNEPGLDSVAISDNLGIYLPIGMIVCSILAVRFVKKDNKLVESMDRLR